MKRMRKDQMFILSFALLWVAMILAVPVNCFGQPRGIEDQIKIDKSVRSGQDLKLAREIERYLERNLRCEEQSCDLTIKVSNGRVAIAGVMQPNDKPWLNKLEEAIVGIRRLDISGVRFIEWTYRPGQPDPRDQGQNIEDRIRVDESSGVGSGDARLAREVERFLETNLSCPEQTCDLTINVINGRVALAGIVIPEDKPLLEKVKENIGGIRRLDLSRVRSHINPFQRGQRRKINIGDQIKIDESVRSGRDLKLAREIERYLEKTVACQRLCDLTINVINGRVALAGIVEPEDRPLLEKVRDNVRGVRNLDLNNVKSEY